MPWSKLHDLKRPSTVLLKKTVTMSTSIFFWACVQENGRCVQSASDCAYMRSGRTECGSVCLKQFSLKKKKGTRFASAGSATRTCEWTDFLHHCILFAIEKLFFLLEILKFVHSVRTWYVCVRACVFKRVLRVSHVRSALWPLTIMHWYRVQHEYVRLKPDMQDLQSAAVAAAFLPEKHENARDFAYCTLTTKWRCVFENFHL